MHVARPSYQQEVETQYRGFGSVGFLQRFSSRTTRYSLRQPRLFGAVEHAALRSTDAVVFPGTPDKPVLRIAHSAYLNAHGHVIFSPLSLSLFLSISFPLQQST